VDLPAALLAHLQELAASIGHDDQELDDTLTALTTALRSTAASYFGFALTVVENQWPVTLAAFTDGSDVPVGTSLRLPLALVSRKVDPASRVIFFAGTAGAFTDLAADLSHALGGIPVDQASSAANNGDDRGSGLGGQRRTIELDADLPPLSRTSGLTGLAELTALNRAIGILVDQGHDIEQAHQLLRSAAAAAGVEPQIYAARIILARASGNDPR
jgi:hypothetical protein